jgi:hypothetical protein
MSDNDKHPSLFHTLKKAQNSYALVQVNKVLCTLRLVTLSIPTLSVTVYSITALSITALSIKTSVKREDQLKGKASTVDLLYKLVYFVKM